jgi:type IV pilus assembly protein PilW
MVALVIGLFLIFGAVTIYQQSRTSFRTTEATARLQEAARLAFDVLEADVRMASYWGLNNRAEYIVNRAAPGAGLPSPFTTAQGARINQCGGANSNWAINLEEYAAGSNNSFPYTATCGAVGTANATADTLVVRRAADAPPASLDPNRIYLQTSRIQGTLFVPSSTCTDPTDSACIPAAYAPPASQSRALVVNAYYVTTTSTLRNDVPALRRKSFGNVNAATASDAITDEEIVPGVEDMQVRFGVDTNGDTNVDQYVNPGSVPAGAAVISATIWLRIRSEERDFGHVDNTAYQYADMASAWTPSDNYRRIVVSKTIMLRNTHA